MSHKMNKKRGVAMMSVLALGATALPITSMVANAGYVDRERVFDNQVTAGADLDLVVTQAAGATINGDAVPAGYEIAWDGVTAGQNSDTNKRGSVRLNAPNIAPGDTVQIPLKPENVGNLPLSYTLDACVVTDTQSATSLDGIDLGDASDFAGVGADTTTTTGVVVSILDSDGNVLGTTDAGGNCTFDTARVLGVDGNEDLTLQLEFPLSMTNAATGAVVDVDLTFNGEQYSGTVLPTSAVASVQAGRADYGLMHGCEIRNGGEVWCWGRNNSGQLGNGTTTAAYESAVRAGTLSDVVKIQSGSEDVFALTSTGDLYGWGQNLSGQLGLGHNQNPVLTPTKINVSNVKDISAKQAASHAVITFEDGTVKMSGREDAIGVGRNQAQYFSTFTSPTKSFSNVIEASVGGNYNTYVLDSDGTLWGTGWRSGNALNTNHLSYNASGVEYGWVQIGAHNDIVDFYESTYGGLYKRANGEVWGWGDNGYGQLGLGHRDAFVNLQRLPHLDNAIEIALGETHMLVLKGDGTVWAAGADNYGQLGLGSTGTKSTLTQIPSLNNVSAVMASYSASSAIMSGTRYAWGSGLGGLGISFDVDQDIPQPVII